MDIRTLNPQHIILTPTTSMLEKIRIKSKAILVCTIIKQISNPLKGKYTSNYTLIIRKMKSKRSFL